MLLLSGKIIYQMGIKKAHLINQMSCIMSFELTD